MLGALTPSSQDPVALRVHSKSDHIKIHIATLLWFLQSPGVREQPHCDTSRPTLIWQVFPGSGCLFLKHLSSELKITLHWAWLCPPCPGGRHGPCSPPEHFQPEQLLYSPYSSAQLATLQHEPLIKKRGEKKGICSVYQVGKL